MKYFVTGSTGFIGSHLIRELVIQGHIVHALVRSISKASEIEGPHVILFQGDILDVESIEMAMTGCDGVFHLAAYVKPWAKDDIIYFDYNVKGAVNILDAAKKLKIKRTIMTSTAGIYGPSIDGPVDEGTTRTFNFFNSYESSKCLADSKIKDYVIEGLDVVSLAPTRVYGPHLFGNLKTDIITQMIKKYVIDSWRFIPGDGNEIGNFVYIDDVVNGYINAMEIGVKGKFYILGGDNQTFNFFFAEMAKIAGVKRKMFHIPSSLIMLFARIELIKPLFGRTPQITPGFAIKNKYNWEIDSSKTNKELKLTPISLKEGLQKTIDWIHSVY